MRREVILSIISASPCSTPRSRRSRTRAGALRGKRPTLTAGATAALAAAAAAAEPAPSAVRRRATPAEPATPRSSTRARRRGTHAAPSAAAAPSNPAPARAKPPATGPKHLPGVLEHVVQSNRAFGDVRARSPRVRRRARIPSSAGARTCAFATPKTARMAKSTASGSASATPIAAREHPATKTPAAHVVSGSEIQSLDAVVDVGGDEADQVPARDGELRPSVLHRGETPVVHEVQREHRLDEAEGDAREEEGAADGDESRAEELAPRRHRVCLRRDFHPGVPPAAAVASSPSWTLRHPRRPPLRPAPPCSR